MAQKPKKLLDQVALSQVRDEHPSRLLTNIVLPYPAGAETSVKGRWRRWSKRSSSRGRVTRSSIICGWWNLVPSSGNGEYRFPVDSER